MNKVMGLLGKERTQQDLCGKDEDRGNKNQRGGYRENSMSLMFEIFRRLRAKKPEKRNGQ